MNEHKTILIPVFLVSQALFVHWTATIEKPPAKPDLTHFPAQIGAWERASEIPVDAATEAQLGADIVLFEPNDLRQLWTTLWVWLR